MIPARRRAVLPPGHWWVAHRRHGRLIVTLSAAVPIDSDLEHKLVCDAVRAWKQHQRRGLMLLPAPIAGGGGLGWLLNQLRRPAVAAGIAVAAAGIAVAAVTVVETPGHAPHRPPAAAGPPAAPRGSQPPRTAPKPTPSRPSVPKQAPKSRPDRPDPGVGVAEPVAARVTAPRVRVRVPPVRVKVPPVHVTPPPVKTPPPPVTAASCRLVRVDVGQLVRVCL